MNNTTAQDEFGQVTEHLKKAGKSVLLFSVVINLLLLVSPVYMLQLYDRVLSSGSKETLLVLTFIAIFLLGVLALMEMVRSRIQVLVADEVDSQVKDSLYSRVIRVAAGASPETGAQSFRDLDTIRQFLASKAPAAFFDAPFTPLFLLVIFAIHPWLGILSLVGAVIIAGLALINHRMSKTLLNKAGGLAMWSHRFMESSLRNHEVLRAMNIADGLKKSWDDKRGPSLEMAKQAAERIGVFHGLTKGARIGLQVLVLGLGGYLALEQQISAGAIVAASIIMGRALAPVEQVVGAWRQVSASKEAYERLKKLFDKVPPEADAMTLPRPDGAVKVKGLVGGLEGQSEPVLKGMNFEAGAGRVVGIIGPSGAGKSVLVRHLVGVMKPLRGSVRLGGIEVAGWHDADRGNYIGYLPQDVELFAGTVAENIARFGELDSEKIVAVAQQAGCHDLILSLPKGYETEIGPSGQFLSGGQSQRIALARAIYNNPALVVLDEPDSNLDTEGEQSLVHCVNALKKSGTTVIMVSHNTRLFGVVDDILVVREGAQADFGPREEVMKKFVAPAGRKPVAARVGGQKS